MRFLRNPHWDQDLRPLTGLDAAVGAYIAEDPAYENIVGQIETLLLSLLPRYHQEGKAYVTIAFGCTGGRHRSVHVTERVAARLRQAGFSPTVRSEEPTSELQSLMRITYAVICLKKNNYHSSTHKFTNVQR